MKLLLLFAVALLAVWLWRRDRSLKPGGQGGPDGPGVSPTPPTPQANSSPMRNCLHCGVHFPAEEAVPGELGLYCSPAHRVAAGDRVPAP